MTKLWIIIQLKSYIFIFNSFIICFIYRFSLSFAFSTICTQCISLTQRFGHNVFFASLFFISCWNWFHLVCCTGSIKYLIFILFIFCLQKYHAHSFILFFGKRYVCKPATFHRRIAANIVTNIYSFFSDLFLGFTPALSFSTISTHTEQNWRINSRVKGWKILSEPSCFAFTHRDLIY